MEDLPNGRSFRRVARLVVKDSKRVPAPALTHPPQEVERDAEKQQHGRRDVTLNRAKV